MNAKIAAMTRNLPCLLSLAVLFYGTRGLALHRHFHLTYLVITVVGIVTGTFFTARWSPRD
ncbi:hypothetical protein [Paraburkholderia xenovorans]